MEYTIELPVCPNTIRMIASIFELEALFENRKSH